ncbi:MAG: molybdopterin-dependent oxidoreductase [Myxococcota bacterium]|nr:molybdopterin-dependent oxidoreductase [Myxococcota bacterium]
MTRRQLLYGAAAGGVVLSVRAFVPRSREPLSHAPAAFATTPRYSGIGDVYRESWTWDKVVRGTHLRANCFSACSFDLYVKQGVVWREEQADVYERDVSGLPDFAPRGCQKGACYSDLMLAPDRVLYPLERAGPRGAGRWRRVSWDHAIDRLAGAIVDAAEEDGPETVVFDNGTSNVDDGPSSQGEMRLFTLLGATLLDGFGGTGDLAMGAVQSWGTTFVDGSADDWTRADLLMLWHCNPMSTRIPDAHFITEARYRGTQVVTVSPDYSPSAVHASLWVGVKQGSDAALALGLARELIERGAIDEPYVREQTDLPLLVRDDTQQFLRQSDLHDGGSDDVFYFYDEQRGEIVEAVGSAGNRGSLALGDQLPALEGRYEASTLPGPVSVRPVFEILRERLAQYDAQHVAEITGVAPGVQARLADAFEESPRALIYASWGSNKNYHADLLQRSLILLSALRGQQGRSGGGVRFAAWLPLDGGSLVPGAGAEGLQRLLLRFYTPPPHAMEDAIAGATAGGMSWTPSHLFLHTHAGLAEAQDADERGEQLPRPPREDLDCAIREGWARVRPAADHPPRVFVVSGANPLRRWPLPQVAERVLWPKLDTIAVVDFRMSTTACKADLVLPAAGYYEKRGIKYVVAIAPYAVVGDRAVAPLGEAKGEWEIAWRLSQAIERIARSRGLTGEIATLHERFSEQGSITADDDEMLLDRILKESTATRVSWEEARQRGAVPLRSAGGWATTSGVGSEIEEGGTLAPSRIHVEDKKPWPTLTGRQQFYLDHPWFLEADEALPRWKPLPRPGSATGDHPILLTGGHTRWSIHAIWRTQSDLLRLQRGGPTLWMSPLDARSRAIRDGESVRVHNEHGSFEANAKLAPSVGPGQAILYHAWEPYQFPNWQGQMELTSSPYKPLHLVGGYGHLRPRVFQTGPLHVPRGVPVEIERAVAAS